jgi:hypothetical protein
VWTPGQSAEWLWVTWELFLGRGTRKAWGEGVGGWSILEEGQAGVSPTCGCYRFFSIIPC